MKLYRAMLVGLAVCGMVFAQEAGTAPACAADAAPAKAAKKRAVKTVTGPVVSVDAAANTVVVKGKKEECQLAVNEKTVIKVAGNTAGLADLQAGSRVTVNYKMEEGRKVAVKIIEKPAAPAKKKAAPEAKSKEKPEEKAEEAAPESPEVPAETPSEIHEDDVE